MIFYVKKMLPSGLIRFGAGERAESAPAGGPGEMFSTGPNGEYRRRSEGGLYFAEERGVSEPTVVSSETLIREQSALSLPMRVVIGAGAVFLLWGVLLVIRKSEPIAWLLIIGGLAMIITPVWRTMDLRRKLRAQAERERAEREETDRRNRELVGEFANVLSAFQKDHGQGAADRVRRAREGREIPYQAVVGMARETVLQIGFDTLPRFEQIGPAGVTRELDTAINAVGLNEDDGRAVRRSFYQKVAWHLMADDRLGDTSFRALDELRRALNLTDEEVAPELAAATQFGYLRGLRLANLPSVDSPVALKYREVAHHRSRGERWRRKKKVGWAPSGDRYLTVTNRRIIVSNGKIREIFYDEIREIEVDADQNLLVIETLDPGRSRAVRIPDPIYTAGVIIAASQTLRKPKGIV